MSTEISLQTTNPIEINKIFGFESTNKPSIPILKINAEDGEDEGGAPKGTFTYYDGDRLLYSDNITVRTFVKALQYKLYHPTDKSKNDMSIIAPSFRAEFRSLSGRIACGKMPSKAYKELGDKATTQQKELQDSVKCKLLIFGLVSGSFTSVDTGEKLELNDELFFWTCSQSSFMIMDQVITGIERERRPVPCTPIKLKLKKEKNGSVTYYVPLPEVTKDTVNLVGDRDVAYLERIKKYVSDTNDYVNKRYEEAIRGKAMDNEFKTLGDILDAKPSSSTDFNDPLAL